ncbi:hypothetical protein HG537_0E00160 [Torulaspora globosa]|uniref:Cell wall protein CWP1 n=1 Tax=Torulaspora globosa TaxID=48254 RepID=A0A7H9HTV1_9SACH|nr:hypothetical protein HG537_0E00160 [Torulaspora sp. CBS 2947]
MKFLSAFCIILLTLARHIIADSESFGLLSIRSGSNLQYASVYVNEGKLYVGSGSELSAVVTDAGKLKFNNDSSTFAVVGSDGTVIEGSEADASDKFSIRNGHLIFNNIDGFYAIPEGASYLFSTQNAENAVGIAIRATAPNGQTVPDFSPPGVNSSSSFSSGTGTPASATSTVAQSETTSVTAVSQTSDGQIIAIQTENSAPRAVVGLGASIAAAAAALLL